MDYLLTALQALDDSDQRELTRFIALKKNKSDRKDLSLLEDLLKGKKVFLTADTMMELPLGRFLHHAGAEVVECSSAYIIKKFHARELEALAGVRVVEQPNFHRQLEDVKRLKPDLIVTSLMTANPFVGHGFVVKWSMEFLLMSIHSWSGVINLANLFVSPLQRRSNLPAFDEKVWLEGVMPSAE